jgi:pimeloyl-ACP methyl ester carboxylesterase
MTHEPSILKLPNGNYIAYHKFEGKKNKPFIVFLGGFMSDMNGTKALYLEEHCKNNDYGYLRFDYFGHGSSSGEFTEGTIGKFKDSAIEVIDQLTEGQLILIGSSLGGWLMNLIAIERNHRVDGMIGIASAPDFTEELIYNKMSDAEKFILENEGVFYIDSEYGEKPYPITLDLIEEGRNHLILKDNIPIFCPVWLIHGQKDNDVPSTLSLMLGKQLLSDNVKVELIEEGDHRMSSTAILLLICKMLDKMIIDLMR